LVATAFYPFFSTGAQRNSHSLIYAFGLHHVTPIAGQPHLQRYTEETSQVHLAPALTLRVTALKDLRNSSTDFQSVVFLRDVDN